MGLHQATHGRVIFQVDGHAQQALHIIVANGFQQLLEIMVEVFEIDTIQVTVGIDKHGQNSPSGRRLASIANQRQGF
jgi:hypothetical protein